MPRSFGKKSPPKKQKKQWKHHLPSLKLTWHLKIDHWKRIFLLETTIFRCCVSFREGNQLMVIGGLGFESGNCKEPSLYKGIQLEFKPAGPKPPNYHLLTKLRVEITTTSKSNCWKKWKHSWTLSFWWQAFWIYKLSPLRPAEGMNQCLTYENPDAPPWQKVCFLHGGKVNWMA